MWATIGLLAAITGSAIGEVTAPVLTPGEGDSLAQFELTVTCASPGAAIHYTLNGAEPTLADPTITSGSTLTIDRSFTVKAKAWVATEQSLTASAVFTLTGDISAGGAHSLAMKSSGDIWAWGRQVDGRLGNNITTGFADVPVPSKYMTGALPIDNARMVAAGRSHSFFLKNGGGVWSYGLNTSTGALGDNTTVSKAMAVQVKTSSSLFLEGCVAVAAGDGFSGALASGGGVYTWGDRSLGRLGNTITITGYSAVAVPVNRSDTGVALGGISRIAFAGATGMAKEWSAYEQIGQLGQVWVWGSNASGQLGQGDTLTRPQATRMKLNSASYVEDALEISCGETHTAVVRWKNGEPLIQGRVLCAGQRQSGRLGNLPPGTNQATLDTPLAVSFPVEVIKSDGLPLDKINSVAAGSSHTLALDLAGNVWAWGENSSGALGDNLTTDRGYAMKVKNPSGTGDLQNIVRIAAGGTGLTNFSLAVSSDGTTYAWGYNLNGQLGSGGTANSVLPVVVAGNLDLLLNNPPVVTLNATVTAPTFPGAITLTATVTDTENDISKVEFYSRGIMVGQFTTPPWKINLSNLTEGSYRVYALATDATNLTSYSTVLDVPITYDPDAANLDTDGDGLTDSTEAALGLSMTDADSDGDGIPDGIDSQPTIADTVPLAAATNLWIWAPAE